jgi:hypothetical protein
MAGFTSDRRLILSSLKEHISKSWTNCLLFENFDSPDFTLFISLQFLVNKRYYSVFKEQIHHTAVDLLPLAVRL